jgi:hypothetical protein
MAQLILAFDPEFATRGFHEPSEDLKASAKASE